MTEEFKFVFQEDYNMPSTPEEVQNCCADPALNVPQQAENKAEEIYCKAMQHITECTDKYPNNGYSGGTFDIIIEIPYLAPPLSNPQIKWKRRVIDMKSVVVSTDACLKQLKEAHPELTKEQIQLAYFGTPAPGCPGVFKPLPKDQMPQDCCRACQGTRSAYDREIENMKNTLIQQHQINCKLVGLLGDTPPPELPDIKFKTRCQVGPNYPIDNTDDTIRVTKA